MTFFVGQNSKLVRNDVAFDFRGPGGVAEIGRKWNGMFSRWFRQALETWSTVVLETIQSSETSEIWLCTNH